VKNLHFHKANVQSPPIVRGCQKYELILSTPTSQLMLIRKEREVSVIQEPLGNNQNEQQRANLSNEPPVSQAYSAAIHIEPQPTNVNSDVSDNQIPPACNQSEQQRAQSIEPANPIQKIHYKKNAENENVWNQVDALIKKRSIYWMPHPAIQDKESIIYRDAVPLNDRSLYGLKLLGYIAQKFSTRLPELISFYKDASEELIPNAFLTWLQKYKIKNMDHPFNKDPFASIEDRERMPIFMNCMDFVYLTLFKASLLTKDQILKIYKQETAMKKEEANRKKPCTKFFGLPISKFKALDHKNPQGKKGDLIFVFDSGNNPVHVMFRGSKNNGAGLWTYPDNLASEFPLDKLKEMYKNRGNGDEITFRICSLSTILNALQDL
jgi:hypothetical protein